MRYKLCANTEQSKAHGLPSNASAAATLGAEVAMTPYLKMKALSDFLDIHTHNLQADADSIISIGPDDTMLPDRYYSVGIHPWSEAYTDEQLARLDQLALDERVVAIGETGLDALRGMPLDRQEQLFRHHIELSEALGKALIIHVVKAIDCVIALRREYAPTQPWIIHGFRGKPQQARQLLNLGFSLAIGEQFNSEAVALIPADRLYTETDTSLTPIVTIRQAIAEARNAQHKL
jgi:TatD DNase family protein